MIRVRNQKAVTRLSARSLKANRMRSCIVVCAIVLTAMLFTSLFTTAGTMVHSSQQAVFRQVGGDAHGTFKDLTKEQKEVLKKDPLVQESGARRMLGMAGGEGFRKLHAELSYMDPVCVKAYFCTPEHGRKPQEGTKEIACDTRFLKAAGVVPEIGAEVTVTYLVDGTEKQNNGIYLEKTDTFSLCGWWEFDPVSTASMAIVPESYVESVQAECQVDESWDLNIYLESSMHIEEDMTAILDHNGYQTDDRDAEHFIAIGVNWAYLGAQASANADPEMAAGVAGMVLLIVLTGYLIIYNIFQISVSRDIRFYGLLKTIGTTGRQIRRMIRRQALCLSGIGIPAGLLGGYLAGRVLASAIMSTMTLGKAYHVIEPWYFVVSAAFTLVTVLLSCAKPGRIAAKVSPVEAVRYTDCAQVKKKRKKGRSGAKPFRMAWSNLARSRKKTMLVVVSMALAVVLLQITYMITTGFDMDKFLGKFVISDYIVGNADYFQTSINRALELPVLPEEDIQNIKNGGEITDNGRIYGHSGGILQYVTEDIYRQQYDGMPEEDLETMLAMEERNAEGKVPAAATLYGMEDYPLDQLQVFDGDLSDVYDPDKHAIAAVYLDDDYGAPMEDTNWAKVGDTVTMRYVREWEYLDTETGASIPENEIAGYPGEYISKEKEYKDVTYEVAACVTIKNVMSYRYYGTSQFVLNAESFQRDSGTSDVMIYMFNTTKESNASMQQYLEDYTQNVNADLDFESKQNYVSQFENFRNVYLLTGGALSVVVGIIGVLNFLNAALTSIQARRREFAMMESIGMTSRQLKSMLIIEGLLYSLLAVSAAFVLGIFLGPVLERAVSSMAWFFVYHYSVLPAAAVLPVFALIGALLPLACYRNVEKKPVVERLRESE